MNLPQLGSPLSDENIKFLEVFAKSCRRSILEMVTNAQSGHPGGSLSSIDYLALIYAMRICKSNEPVVVSNGHISPAVYSVLAELDVIPKENVIKLFRKPTDIYEGHVNRRINGVFYGTGPLGVGGSVASGFALGNRLTAKSELVFLLMGDGEQQEGQVFEMLNFANKYKLGNLIMFVDFNEVQLTDSLDSIMPINIEGHYLAAGWHVIHADGHDFNELWSALHEASQVTDKPTIIIGHTIMGKGVEFMEAAGRNYKSDWHGKAPSQKETDEALQMLSLTQDENEMLKTGLNVISPCLISTPKVPEIDSDYNINPGTPIVYASNVKTDCRSAYGTALLSLAKLNKNVLAMTADLAGSVKTDGVKSEIPEHHIECGIAEQHMISVAGGLSIRGFVPFASTFGAFMTSRAKDQARVNDINETNVKMVATHCGLSVGEDGPTHQVIDDISSFAGFMHTNILEPADPNQCDKIIRYIAKTHGNFYVRMGRTKVSVITKSDGITPFFGEDYEFIVGKADLIRSGEKATIIASGPMVERAVAVAEKVTNVEVLAVNCFVPFDKLSVVDSAKRTKKILTLHDHNVHTGLAMFVERALFEEGICVPIKHLGVYKYQLSGTSDELYELAGLGFENIERELTALIQM